MKTLYIVMLLLEWWPKVVTIAHGAPYQHTTMVSRPNGRILIRRVGTRHHYRLTRACQDAKGKRPRKTYVSLGNLYFIREGERSVYANHLKSLERLLVKQREKYDKRVEANPRKWLLQLSNRSRYKVLLLKAPARPPYILLVYGRVIQSTRML